MKTVGDWKVNEAWLQQVYKRVCMDKTNLQCLQQFECQHAVANTMYTNSSKTFIDQGLRQHNVKNAGPSYCLVSGSDKTQLNPAELRVQYHCLCIHIMSTTNEIIATMAAAGHQEVITSLIQTCKSD